MKNKMITQRRYKVEQRSKMVAVMAAIFFVLGGITPTNVVSVKATSLDSDVKKGLYLVKYHTIW